MVPGLNERAGQAAARQSREWLAEALREQARRVPTPARRRTDNRFGIAMVWGLANRGRAIGVRLVARLVVGCSAWRSTRSDSRTVAGAPPRYPRQAERMPTEAGR